MENQPKNKDFARLPHWIVDSGALAKMKPTTIKVFFVILRYANYNSGVSFPNRKTIIEKSNVKKDTIKSCLDELVALGVINLERASKRFNFKNIYTINSEPPNRGGTPLRISPNASDKCKKYTKGPDGKFCSSPSQSDINSPSESDKDCPKASDNSAFIRTARTTIKREEIIKRDNLSGSASAGSKSQASPDDLIHEIKDRKSWQDDREIRDALRGREGITDELIEQAFEHLKQGSFPSP